MVDTNLSYSLTNNDNNNYSRKYTYVSSRLLKSLNYPDFRKALSWDSISKLYNKKYLASTKPLLQEKTKTFPYLMDIGFNVKYAEWLEIRNASHSIIIHSNHAFRKSIFFVVFYLEHLEYNCTFSVAPLTRDMPPSNSIALLAANQSYSTDVWYDNIAIFSTRGCSNIYHNSEWIANFYHMAMNIEKFPLVSLFSFVVISFQHLR